MRRNALYISSFRKSAVILKNWFKQKNWKIIKKKNRKIINLLEKACFNKKGWKLYIKRIIQNFKTIYKDGWKIIKFDDTEIEKYKSHQHKKPISIDNTGVNKIVVSDEVSW